MQVRDELAAALRLAVRGEVRFDAVSRMLYRTDASIYEIEPLGLVVPRDEDDVAAAVAEKHAAAWKVVRQKTGQRAGEQQG